MEREKPFDRLQFGEKVSLKEINDNQPNKLWDVVEDLRHEWTVGQYILPEDGREDMILSKRNPMLREEDAHLCRPIIVRVIPEKRPAYQSPKWNGGK